MYFIPESCSHDTLLTAFHGFIRAFKYGIGTLTRSNVLNQNLSLEKIYSIGVDLIRFGSLLSCVRCIKCKSSQYIKLLKYLNQGNLLNMIIYLSYGDENHCKLVKCTCASCEIMSFQ